MATHTKHTPTPWFVDPKRRFRIRDAADNTIASTGTTDSIRDQWEGNADLIARAASCHDDLLEALKASNDLLFGLLDYFEPGHELTAMNVQRDKNNAVLAKAEQP